MLSGIDINFTRLLDYRFFPVFVVCFCACVFHLVCGGWTRKNKIFVFSFFVVFVNNLLAINIQRLRVLIFIEILD